MARDTRETLDTKIRELNDQIIELGSIVESAVRGSVEALENRFEDFSEELTNGLSRQLHAASGR